jgi:hypothetical protein
MSNYKDKSENEGKEEPKIPDEFSKVIKDLIRDIKETFPEVVPLINKWWKESSDFEYIDNEVERTKAFEESQQSSIKFLFSFCQKKFPPRFFEILYQNDEMFKVDSDIDTEFLPHIHFKNLWQFDITQKTRDTIWKYLQLILFSIVGSLENRDAFGDSAKLFEAINQDDFKNKLEETLSQMQGLFDIPMPSSTNNENATNSNDENDENDENNENNENNNSSKGMPNADDIHEHINGMLDGQLGKLAKEIAEETAANLNIDMENVTDMKDVFSNLVKNPTKLMGLVKSVGDKLDSRIKSGEIKESELISEATDIMNKMKNMPGMENIQSMLGKMGIPGLGGKNAKMNMGAMEAQMNKNMKTAQMRERMKAKLEAANLAKAQAQTPLKQGEPLTDEQIFSVFSTGEKVERTPRGAKPEPTPTKGKKKKGKK